MKDIVINKTIWLYWENKKGFTTPGYIQLCHQILKNKCGDSVKILDEHSISEYIPEEKLQILDTIFEKPNPNRPKVKHIAHKSDYIRAILLKNYGGLWIDSDAIVVDDLRESILTLLQIKEFVVLRKNVTEKEVVSIGLMASVAEGKIISKYLNEVERILESQKGILNSWTQLGSDALSPIVSKYEDTVHILPEKKILPVNHENFEIMFNTYTGLEHLPIYNEKPHVIMLFNSLFTKRLKSLSEFKLWSKKRC